MSRDVRVEGAQRLHEVSKQLRAMGDKDTQKALAKGIREALKPFKADLKRSALDTLPGRGGLAKLVAGSKITNRTTTSARGASVRVTTANANARGLRAMDRGQLKHPTHGHRDRWVTQAVRPGWWSTPVKTQTPAVQKAVLHAIEEAAKKIGT